ncbi:MAG: XamI family restriction endonuclease [Gemmatimonadetes bacterium]|nr:XamI family restriction endonuclease [Gemmatimonadota bacterium]MYI06289.1 XamI family restriction endonuclease [Gemmatimonadota bacterium]
MAVNLDKPHRWKSDIAESVRLYNRWFLASAPKAFREQRETATVNVTDAMVRTGNLTRIDAATLESHPDILPSLRMAACPPLARDRLVGLAGVSKSLVLKMEKDGVLPPRMAPAELFRSLTEIGRILTGVLDRDICPWIAENRAPAGDEAGTAAIIIADRLCGMSANPIIRNAQERRQLDRLEAWLSGRRYDRIPPGDPKDPASMPPGSFSFHMNVEGWMDEHGVNTVKIPVDIVIKPRGAASGDLPLFVEAKSAGDFTNVNKRRKEEAAKAGQLRRRLGSRARFVLFLGGYFDSGYLGYEAAESIDWVWEHRIDDFEEFGL